MDFLVCNSRNIECTFDMFSEAFLYICTTSYIGALGIKIGNLIYSTIGVFSNNT
nr:MAG TPA: protein of unknown function (DUF5377) [Caudoviricetes sp.]